MIVALFVALIGAKLWWDAGYYNGYEAELPLNAIVQAEEAREGYRRVAFAFDSVPGQRVPGLLALPPAEGRYPCVIFLHGIGQSKSFLDDIAPFFTSEGFALVTYDQYTRGERRLDDPNPVEEALALRRRAALNVIETRRLIDYLETRADIAADRIYLVGASFGAITGATAAAFDERMRAVVLTYGGGDLPVLLNSEAARGQLGFLTRPLSYIGACFLAPADPIRHVDEIAPRPILFQNGREDSLIPPASALALFNAAEEPKELVWYEGDHIGLDEATVRRVLDDAVVWLQARDAEILAAQGASADATRHADRARRIPAVALP